MNQGTICAKVYPEGIQPIKGNNCGLIPLSVLDLYQYTILFFQGWPGGAMVLGKLPVPGRLTNLDNSVTWADPDTHKPRR